MRGCCCLRPIRHVTAAHPKVDKEYRYRRFEIKAVASAQHFSERFWEMRTATQEGVSGMSTSHWFVAGLTFVSAVLIVPCLKAGEMMGFPSAPPGWHRRLRRPLMERSKPKQICLLLRWESSSEAAIEPFWSLTRNMPPA